MDLYGDEHSCGEGDLLLEENRNSDFDTEIALKFISERIAEK